MSRVVAIGLDAVERGLVGQLLRDGRLPNLARLHARAATVDLHAEADYRSEYPWGEFGTGRRAATLRYWTTVAFDPEDYGAYMRGAPDATPFYALDGATVVAFDVPKLIRSPDVEGVQVLGWGAHSPQYPYGSIPDGLLPEIVQRFGPSPGLPLEYAGSWHQGEYLSRFGNAQARAIRTRAEILRWLASRTPDWDLIVTLIGETHQLGHMTMHGFVGRLAEAPTAPTARAAMIAALEAVDDVVADVVSWVPDDTVVVVFSAHGMRDADDEITGSLVPEILLRATTGEARLPSGDLDRWRRRGAPPLIPAQWDDPHNWFRRRFDASHRESRSRPSRLRVRHALRTHAPALLRARRRLLGRPEPVTTIEPPRTFPFRDHSMDDWHVAAWYRDAWPRLPAFVIPGFSDAQIRINLAGRERDGIVDRDDYERACDDVERVLRACRDGATGASVVREVHRVRADDPFAPDGPPADLIVQLEGADAVEHPEFGAVGPVVAARTGGHTANGFAFVAGPGIAPGPRGAFEVCDLSATITALVGAPSRSPLDGTAFLGAGVHR